MNSRAGNFETEVADILAEMNGNPVNHADNLNAWLYGVRQGTIPKTRYSVLPDDNKIAQFNAQWHQACISQGGAQQNAGVTWATNNQAVKRWQPYINFAATQCRHLHPKWRSIWIKQSLLQRDPTPSQPRGIKEWSYPKDTPKHNQDDLQGSRLLLHRWNRSPPSNLLSFHQPRKGGNGSVGFSASIQRKGVSRCYLCLGNNKCPIRERVPVCRLQHPQQFHNFLFSRARAKLGQSPARLSYLPPDSSRRTIEIFRQNQRVIEAIGSRTFWFQWTWNPNPTI